MKHQKLALTALALTWMLLLCVGCGGGEPAAPAPADSPAIQALEPAAPASGQASDPADKPETPAQTAGEPDEQPASPPAGADNADARKDAAPAPEAPSPQTPEAETQAPACTVSISCALLLEHLEELDADKVELVPADGWILQPVDVPFTEGESVFDVLRRVCRESGIPMEYQDTPLYDSAYIEGIANLYEFDCGELSGWMYRVNDWHPNYGCSKYVLKDGDTVSWDYTCELGADLGSTAAAD